MDNSAAQSFFDFEKLQKLARLVLPMPEHEAEEDFMREQVQRALLQDKELWRMHCDGSDTTEIELQEEKVFEDPYQVERHYIWSALLHDRAINIVQQLSGPSVSYEQAKKQVAALRDAAKNNTLPKPQTHKIIDDLMDMRGSDDIPFKQAVEWADLLDPLPTSPTARDKAEKDAIRMGMIAAGGEFAPMVAGEKKIEEMQRDPYNLTLHRLVAGVKKCEENPQEMNAFMQRAYLSKDNAVDTLFLLNDKIIGKKIAYPRLLDQMVSEKADVVDPNKPKILVHAKEIASLPYQLN